jgi:hypothetical protein
MECPNYLRERVVKKNDPVRFQGERYRVVRVKGVDVVIRNVEGRQLTVHHLTVEAGW